MRRWFPKPGGWPGGFDLAGKRARIQELEAEMSQPAFWSDRARADELIKELGILSNVVNEFDKLESLLGSLEKECGRSKILRRKENVSLA